MWPIWHLIHCFLVEFSWYFHSIASLVSATKPLHPTVIRNPTFSVHIIFWANVRAITKSKQIAESRISFCSLPHFKILLTRSRSGFFLETINRKKNSSSHHKPAIKKSNETIRNNVSSSSSKHCLVCLSFFFLHTHFFFRSRLCCCYYFSGFHKFLCKRIFDVRVQRKDQSCFVRSFLRPYTLILSVSIFFVVMV